MSYDAQFVNTMDSYANPHQGTPHKMSLRVILICLSPPPTPCELLDLFLNAFQMSKIKDQIIKSYGLF